MRPTLAALKKSGSSARWLNRQSRDPYVKDRINEAGVEYRSRSAFKLTSLLDKYPQLWRNDRGLASRLDGLAALEDGTVERKRVTGKVVVDLGAAPGGWSQVIRRKLRREDLVFALDILDIQPIHGVDILQGDFLDAKIQQRFREMILSSGRDGNGAGETLDTGPRGLVDLVLSDMMGSMTGNRTANIRMSLDLVEAATTFAFANLKSASDRSGDRSIGAGGHLVMKFFMHPDLTEFQKEVLEPRFKKVAVPKPKESRKGKPAAGDREWC